MEINVSPLLAKFILKINPFTKIKVMCRGYSEDLKNFTELVWQDDKCLDFYDNETYPQFQIWIDGKWIQARTKGTGGINTRTGERRPITRAFYARKELVSKIFELSDKKNIKIEDSKDN